LVTLATADPDSDECVIQGNPDILGIGVRIGIYFQLGANLAMAFIHPSEAISSLAVTNMLMTGIFISVVSIRNNIISSAELICALWIVVLDFPVILPITASAEKATPTIWTVNALSLLWLAFVGLNVWFWFRGLQSDHESQCPDPRTFFFANLSAQGKILTFTKLQGFSAYFSPASCSFLPFRQHTIGFSIPLERRAEAMKLDGSTTRLGKILSAPLENPHSDE
jgi:hypothetical protein